MTHKHVAFENLASRLIEANGSPILLIRRGALDESTYPPTNGPNAEFTFNAVQTGLDFKDTQSGNTEVGDLKFLVATGETVPTTDDEIKVNNARYTIVSVDRVAPATDVLVWKIIARGGVPDTIT